MNTNENCSFNVPDSILSLNLHDKKSLENDINSFYKNILSCLLKSLKFLVNSKGQNGNNKARVPGWNIFVKDFYAVGIQKSLLWKQNGSIRSGDLYEDMKSSRQRFKLALRYCRANAEDIACNNFIETFLYD